MAAAVNEGGVVGEEVGQVWETGRGCPHRPSRGCCLLC